MDGINVSNFNRISAKAVKGRIAVFKLRESANPAVATSVSDNIVSRFRPDARIEPRLAADRQRGLHDLSIDDNRIPSLWDSLAACVELQFGFLAVSHSAVCPSVPVNRKGWELAAGRTCRFVDEFFERILRYAQELRERWPHLFARYAASLPRTVGLLQDTKFYGALSLGQAARFLLVDDELGEARFWFRHREGDRQILTNL